MRISYHLFCKVFLLLSIMGKDGYCQTYTFINRASIKTHNIQSISFKHKNCNNYTREYLFEKGELKYEHIKEDSLERENEYYYANNSLVVKYIMDIGQAKRSINYTYSKGKLISSVEVEAYYFGGGTSEFEYGDFIRYKYDSEGRLKNDISFEADSHGNPTTLRSTKYMIYNNKELIGYFPFKNESEELTNITDTIYYRDKLQELKKIGFDNFSKKYFTKEVYKKIIDDCYTPIKNKELLVNGEPVKEFLSKIGKSEAKHIIFEIADNYFLFYKLID